MKVLIVSQHFWPEDMRINNVAADLVKIGVHVEVLTGQPNYPEGRVFPGYRARLWRRQVHDGIFVTRLPIVPRGPGGAIRLVLNYLSFVVSGFLLAPWLLRKSRYDIIFVYATSPLLQAIPAIFLARVRRVPIILWVQDLWPESLVVTGYVRNRHILAAVSALVRWIYRACNIVLVQSDAMVAEVVVMAGSTPVRVYPNPGDDLDDAVLSPAPKLSAGFNVVFAGNLGAAQALDSVIEAAALILDTPAINFVFAGSGSRAAWLADTISKRGLTNCVMLGRLPTTAMPRLFDQAGVLLASLVPGQAMSKTVPSKIQSYLAAGKPIIAALDGEAARIVRLAGAGLVARAGSALDLATAVRRLYGMTPGERGEFGKAGRAFYEAEYAAAVLTPRLLTVFDDAITRGARYQRRSRGSR